MSEFAGNSPRTFICCHCLEKKSNVKEKSQIGEDQELVISPPGTSADTVQIPEIDTSAVKAMTVLQSTRPGTNTAETTTHSMKRVPQEVVNPEGSVGSSGDTDIKVYCENKHRSLSEILLQSLVEMSEESITKFIGMSFC